MKRSRPVSIVVLMAAMLAAAAAAARRRPPDVAGRPTRDSRVPIVRSETAGSTSISRARPSRSAFSTARCSRTRSPTSCG